VPRAYEDEGVYEGKKIIERDQQREKMRKKGPTKVKIKGIDPQNFFCSANFIIVPTKGLGEP
jgi:hypothetical protein